MPISSLRPNPNRSHRLWLPLCLLLASTCAASAQALAKPGWKGSGVTADPWWKRAIFYQVASGSPETDFKALTARLDALRSLDVDALILPAPALPAPGSNDAMPNLDNFDDLLRQAGNHHIRVLLTIQAPSSSADLSGLVRFWLNRGVAGLHIATSSGTSPEQTQAIVQAVRKQASGALGQRIILSDLDLAPPEDAPSGRHAAAIRVSRAADAAQLQIDSPPSGLATLDAASLRPFLVQTIAQPNLLLDLRTSNSSSAAPDARSPQAEAIATIALISHPAALIDSSANLVLEPTLEQPKIAEEPAKPAPPPPPPATPPGTYLPFVPYVPPSKPKPAEALKPKPLDPLTNWYRQLAALHHDNAVLRTGSKTFLDFDAQNALVWVSRPASPTPLNPAVVVLCNLSPVQVQLSLTAAMKSLDLHGFFLRALLRSDNGMGAQDLDSVTLPPYSVYIGELRR